MDTEKEFFVAMGKGVWIEDNPVKVQDALDKGFDPNYYDNYGAATLHRVAEAGCVKAMEVFLRNEITRTDLKDHFQQTPLHYAIHNQNFESAKQICQMLLDIGLNINEESNFVDYPTPLFLCIKYKHVKLARYLLEQGADINFISFFDCTALTCTICSFGEENNDEFENNEFQEIVYLLLYYNVDVNYPFNEHAIFNSIVAENMNIFQILLYYTDFDLVPPTFLPDVVRQCLVNKLDDEIIVDLIQKTNLNLETMIQLLEAALFASNLKIFNLLYKQLQSLNVDDNFLFFGYDPSDCLMNYNLLSKNDCISFIFNLFDHDFGRIWLPDKVQKCLLDLFEIKRTKQLTTEDLKAVLSHVFQFVDTVCPICIARVFVETKFNDDFEIIIKYNPIVRRTPCENCKGSNIKSQDLFKLHLVDTHYCKVQSLKLYSRDAIRKLIIPQTIEGKLFSYYNEIQKLQIPCIIKDIITRKHELPINYV